MTHYAFELEQLNKKYRFFNMRNVSMRLEYGQILGFIGPNGAGKSTTIRMLMGLVMPDAGNVRVFDKMMPEQQVAIKRDIGFVSSDMQLYQPANVAWHLDWMAKLHPGWDTDYAQTLLKRFNLHAPQHVGKLSQGERMKLLHILALARRPRLLVLDEPTSGLDPVARHEVLSEITDIMQDENRAVLFSSHYTQDVEQISDQIVFIDRGHIVDSQDRESYLERWRRVVFDTTDRFEEAKLPEAVNCKLTGHSGELTSNDYNEKILETLKQAGAVVRNVETMTLEEIFVELVVHKRREENE